jgi:hypothetical protein
MAYNPLGAIAHAVELEPNQAVCDVSPVVYTRGLYPEDIRLVTTITKNHPGIYGAISGLHQLFYIELDNMKMLERYERNSQLIVYL